MRKAVWVLFAVLVFVLSSCAKVPVAEPNNDVGSYTDQSSSIGIDSSAENNSTDIASESMDKGSGQEVVTFHDPTIEDFIRGVIQRPVGKITSSELDRIHRLQLTVKLHVSGGTGQYYYSVMGYDAAIANPDMSYTKGQIDLSDINLFRNLSELDLGLPATGDFQFDESILSNLGPNLSKLVVTGVKLNSLSFLEKYPKLTDLTLDNVGLSDISELSSLIGLTNLSLPRNNISDVAPLSSLTNLVSLNLSYNSIADFSPLDSLVGLKQLQKISQYIPK